MWFRELKRNDPTIYTYRQRQVAQIINPDGLTKCIEGNIVQGVSRTLWEEVTFDSKSVTSVDWLTYPILDITETPGEIDVVLIDHPEIAPTGAGEPSIRPVAAAIANAIFDATGVRIRRVPFCRSG
jgi:nicotinate dehydrogenase subunit B